MQWIEQDLDNMNSNFYEGWVKRHYVLSKRLTLANKYKSKVSLKTNGYQSATISLDA